MWPMKGKTQRRREITLRLADIEKERVCFLNAILKLDAEKKRLEKAIRKLGG